MDSRSTAAPVSRSCSPLVLLLPIRSASKPAASAVLMLSVACGKLVPIPTTFPNIALPLVARPPVLIAPAAPILLALKLPDESRLTMALAVAALVGGTFQFRPTVPPVVTGDPLTVKSEEGALKPTLVTVPLPPAVWQVHADPFQASVWPELQLVVRLKFRLPAAAPPVRPLPLAVVTPVMVPVPAAEQAHAVPFHCRTCLAVHVFNKLRLSAPRVPPPVSPLPSAVVTPVMVPVPGNFWPGTK